MNQTRSAFASLEPGNNMKNLLLLSITMLFFAGLVTRSADALLYDQNVTSEVIFGSGNANGSWTVDRDNGVELGLRAKVRFNAANLPENTFNSDGAGNYTFGAGLPPTGFGFAPGSPSTAKWNFEWSINSNFDGSSMFNLSDLTYEIRIDFDPSSPGTNFLSFDPINVPIADNAIGTNLTGNGAGAVAANPTDYSGLIAGNNLAQNSWNMEFFDDGGGFSFAGNNTGEYSFELLAFNGATQVASTAITVNAVPEPSAVLFGSLVCGVLGANYARKRFNKLP